MIDMFICCVRLLSYLLCLAIAVYLILLWRDPNDWARIPIVLQLQFHSFDLFISRRPLKLSTTRCFMFFVTILYVLAFFQQPVSPEKPEAEVTLEHFNASAAGQCQLAGNDSLCYGDSRAWIMNNFTWNGTTASQVERAIGYYQAIMEIHMAIECTPGYVQFLCSVFLPPCDISCEANRNCTSLQGLPYSPVRVFDFCLTMNEIIVTHDLDLSDSLMYTSEDAALWNRMRLELPYPYYESNTAQTICESLSGSRTILNESVEAGFCNQQNAIPYENYLINGPNTTVSFGSYTEDMEVFTREYSKREDYRLYTSLTILTFSVLVEVTIWLWIPYQDTFCEGIKLCNFTLVSTKGRLFSISMSIVLGFLTYILISMINLLELEGTILNLSLAMVSVVGCSISNCLFRLDRIAEKCTQIKKVKDTTVGYKWIYAVFRCYKLYVGRGGRYEYVKLVLSEVLEIIIQTRVMLDLVRLESISISLTHTIILSINVIVSPSLLLNSSSFMWRTMNRTMDSLLDLSYIFVLYLSISSDSDISTNSTTFAFGVLLPSYRLTIRIMILCFSVVKQNIDQQQGATIESSGRLQYSPTQLNKKFRYFVIGLCICAGATLGVSSTFRVIKKIQECKDAVGATIWNGMGKQTMFPDGLMGTLSCSFNKVSSLNWSGTGLTEVPEFIYLLDNLEELDLSDNNLTTLPVEMIKLENLKSLNLQGNPVRYELDWSSQEIDYFPQFLDLIPSLERLYLRDNMISAIELNSTSLTSLTLLDLSGNSMEYLSTEFILSLEALVELNLTHNDLRIIEDDVWEKESLMLLDVSSNQLSNVSIMWGARPDNFIAHAKDNPIFVIDWSMPNSESWAKYIIVDIPEEILELSNLSSIIIRDQPYVTSLEILFSMTSLTSLDMFLTRIGGTENTCEATFIQSLKSLRIGRLKACDNEVSIESLDISTAPSYMLCLDTEVYNSWKSVQHFTARNIQRSSCNEVSQSISTLTNLRTLDIRGSTSLKSFMLNPVPVNLTYVDLTNTSMSLSHVEAALHGFDCTYPDPFICTRAL